MTQGHPTDRFGKLSVRKAAPTSNFRDVGNLRPSVFGLKKMSFRVPKKAGFSGNGQFRKDSSSLRMTEEIKKL